MKLKDLKGDQCGKTSSKLHDCSSTVNSCSYNSQDIVKPSFCHVKGLRNKPTPLESLCKAFQTNSCSLNSPFYKLDQSEFHKVSKSLAFYKSCLPMPESTRWCVEFGETSKSCMSVVEAAKEQLVCYVLGKKCKVIGKLVIKNAEKKLIVPKIFLDGNSNLQLLKSMGQLTCASIKDRYQVPAGHTKLNDVEHSTASRLQLFGVVTAVNKIPTKTKASWHSLLCISDPSLINISTEENEDLAPSEFKMHFFLPRLEDHPELHRGDVVRFTNVKIESHQNRCDGRVFSKSDITVYCFPDSKAQYVPHENSEERSAVVRVLSQWWSLNHRFFDYLTPHPIHHLPSRYAGIRNFKEFSNQLVCDVFCQVVNMADDSSEMNFLYVQDGTIFTLKERPKPDGTETELASILNDRPPFGYLALAVFDSTHWNRIKALKISLNDYIFMRDVKVVFLTEETLTSLSSNFPFRYPFVLLRPAVDNVKKLPFSHHEAYKIRSRLHRLPQELEKMTEWEFPPPTVDDEPEDPFLARLNQSSVQIHLLKRLKRF